MVRIALDTVDSTQAEAIRRARVGAAEGTVVVARRQSAGQGRLDHKWVSPPGGAYVSVVSEMPAAGTSVFPLAVAVELADRLESATGVPISLKWPNDLLIVRRENIVGKLGGVLVDRVDAPEGKPRAVVGVGVNVTTARGELPPSLGPSVAILSELADRRPAVEDVVSMIVDSVAAAREHLDGPPGASAVLARYRGRLFGVGRPVTLDGRPLGILRSIADDGSATVERAGELTRVVAGDLVVGDPA